LQLRLLEFLACHACGGSLSLLSCATEKPPAEGLAPEIEEGEIVCQSCGQIFPVRGFVPDLRLESVRQQSATITHYNALWGDGVSSNGFKPHSLAVAQVVPLGIEAGQVVLDAGCGNGNDTAWLARRHPDAQFIAVDISEGIYSAQRLTASLSNAHPVRASVLSPPFRRGVVDLLYSYGALHHTPDPESAFVNLSPTVRGGGRAIIYVYTDLREEPLMRLALLPVTTFRGLTRRLSPGGLQRLAFLLSPFMFLTFGLPARMLRAVGRQALAERLPFNWVRSPGGASGDLFDRFGAEYEWRHNPKQLRSWFVKGGFREFAFGKIPDRRGWVAWGRKSEAGE
jgi:SAM-dependent methyltransferase